MQKISGIIPGSRRVTNVDLKDAHPVRPGVPQFGRPMGISGPSLSRSSMATNMGTMSEARNPVEQARMDIVNRVSDGFFMQKLPEPTADINSRFDDLSVESLNAGGLEPSLNSLDEALLYQVESQEKEGEVPEFVRAGRYLDVTV